VTPKSRLTRTGSALLVGFLATLGFGLVTHYREFLLLAVAGFILLLLALVMPAISSAVELHRFEVPKFVTRGTVAEVGLRASADGVVPPLRIVDQLAGIQVPIDLPQITARTSVEVRYQIQAVQRGVHQVGPVLEERMDPFGIAVRSTVHDVIDRIYVHPVVHSLNITTDGARERQRSNMRPRISDDPLADFRALREYVPGDDPRLIHWASTARTGQLVVKDHFELRRAMRMVVLETFEGSITPPMFEHAVEIAASITINAIENSILCVARTRDSRAPGSLDPVEEKLAALELFTRVQRTSAALTVGAGQIRPIGPLADQVFLIAGPSSPLIRAYSANPWVKGRLTLIRMTDTPGRLARTVARTLDVTSAEDFVAKWKTSGRRAVAVS
jgi:uncharacterized protein (DUF58 family)